MAGIYRLCATSLLITFAGFYMVEHLFTILPERISGNGNLGLLVIMILLPFLAASLVLTVASARRIGKTVPLRLKFILPITVTVIAILLGCILYNVVELIHALGGTPDNPKSRIYRYGWFNQYTNSFYFNTYTFLLVHTLSCSAGLLSVIGKREDL